MCVYNYSNPLIFTYHSISSNFHVGLNSVHPNRFRKHIEFIANLNNSTVENNHIKIAFDDGYESVYTNAFPIMEEYGLKGIVFPITGYIGKNNNWDVTFGINQAMHLNIDQILSLSDNGWEIGSHGHLHKSFKWLKIDEIKKDVEISKRFIENIIGNPKPPKNPVLAGLTASIDSIAGSETSLKIIKPTKIIDPIPIFLLFDFGKFFKT